APVAAERAKRRKAHCPAVGFDAEAVDAAPARHGKTEVALASGTEDGERVVADDEIGRPAARGGSLAIRRLLVGEVERRHQQCDEIELAAEFFDEALNDVEASLDAESM